MAYQVKTTKNYGNRLLDSLKGAGKGFIVLFVGTIMLCANEGNYVKQDKTIGAAAKSLVRVGDVSSLDTALEGRLIHAYAFAETQDVLVDDQFGVRERAIALKRAVEYYQYQEKSSTETKDKLGGAEEKTTTYTYEKKWVTSPVNSGGFADPDYKKSNFVLDNDVKSQDTYAANVTFGAYKLPRFIITSIRGGIPAELKLTNDELTQLNNRVTKRMSELGLKADSGAVLAHVQGNVVYLGKSPSSPQVGDVRITLTKAAPADISIIAKVVGSTFEQYIAPGTGRIFTGVAMGTVSADTMIESAKKTNSFITWLLRFLGILLVVVSLKMVFNILPTLFKVLPPLGKIVGAGAGLVCWVGGIAWSFVVISLAWLFYRPLIGIPLLVIAAFGIWFLSKKAKEKKAVAAHAAAHAAAPTAAITADGWTCGCGTVNKGKFCADCGKPKPAGVPRYKCGKCGWEPRLLGQPENMANLPKFCPDCGAPFGDGDIVK
jgi:hypothetical protein